MKVLFLDIDGVLTSHRTDIAFRGVSWSGSGGIHAKMDDVAIRLIGGIARRAGAKIVLSSSWRNDSNWLSIGPAIDMEITERTPSLSGCCGNEIAHWLSEHPEVECYAIIDDNGDMLPEQMPYFVHTNYTDGFLFSHATKLAELLGISIYDVNYPEQPVPQPCKTPEWLEA